MNELKSLTLNGKKYDVFVDPVARENGGGSAEGAVLYTEQTLPEEQQAQARENIGAASVGSIDNIKSSLHSITTQISGWVNVDFEVILGKVITNSNKISNADKDFGISSYIPVVPGEKLLITASKDYANNLWTFWDKDGGFVARYYPADGMVSVADEEVTVPPGASTLVISFCYGNIGVVKRLSEGGALRLQPWKGRIWTAVGDSLTESNARTDLNYHDYIAEATGITVVNQGNSGSGYAKTGQGKAFHLRIANVNPNSDVVTIFGSFNDYSAGIELGTPSDSGTETICGCINTTIDNLIAVMPAVSLGIVTPTPWDGSNPSDPNNAHTKYADALVAICKNRSIPCLDLYRCSNLRPWSEEGRLACYSKDGGSGTHPDETGHKLIASRFKAFLESLIM